MQQTSSENSGSGLKKGNWPGGLLKGALFLLLLLVLLEGGLRLAGKILAGTRPFEFGPTGAARTVLCVGDSYTYGGNVGWRDAYPHQLFLSLGSASGVRVINGGHCEYNSSQVLGGLAGYLEKYKPSEVLLLAGSSDRWNMLAPDASDPKFIPRADYDGEMERTAAPDRFPASLRIYKMYRGIRENLLFRYLLRTAERLRAEELSASFSAGRVRERELLLHMNAMMYRNRYDELFSLALSFLEKMPSDSVYFSKDLSVYFTLSISFRYQAGYSAAQTAQMLERILAARPEFSASEPFMKYLAYFRSYSRLEPQLEKRLEDNLEKMAAQVKASGARLIVLNYPGEHALANVMLARLAKKHGAAFIDNYGEFRKLMSAGGRDRYLIGDDHATPEGYREMAGFALNELRAPQR